MYVCVRVCVQTWLVCVYRIKRKLPLRAGTGRTLSAFEMYTNDIGSDDDENLHMNDNSPPSVYDYASDVARRLPATPQRQLQTQNITPPGRGHARKKNVPTYNGKYKGDESSSDDVHTFCISGSDMDDEESSASIDHHAAHGCGCYDKKTGCKERANTTPPPSPHMQPKKLVGAKRKYNGLYVSDESSSADDVYTSNNSIHQTAHGSGCCEKKTRGKGREKTTTTEIARVEAAQEMADSLVQRTGRGGKQLDLGL